MSKQPHELSLVGLNVRSTPDLVNLPCCKEIYNGHLKMMMLVKEISYVYDLVGKFDAAVCLLLETDQHNWSFIQKQRRWSFSAISPALVLCKRPSHH